ncbi:MAG TPA: hypothetical protein VMT21_01485 [Gemmatimonadales bacterium]|nr:hypothetical protein [Gemmatimonadales bacterium]
MADDWNDEELPEPLRGAVRGYNQPPPAPRDQMWWAISAARARRRSTQRIARRVYWGLALAATLILGIGIGRLVSRAAGPLPALQGSGAYASASAPYRVAAGQYLARTEVLLTDFTTESRKGRLDPQFVASARDLLTTTRLMLDSPAADDPQLKVLLQDLELVLAQVTQLPEEPRQRRELDLINQGLTQRGVLARIRAATPAPGAPPSTRAQGVL